MGKPEGNEPSFGEQVPGLGAPSEEWQEIFRAILSAKNAHGPDSEIAERIAKYALAPPGDAHVLMPNAEGWTLAYACVWRNRPRCLLELMRLGADPRAKVPTSERSAIETAHMEGRHLCTRILRMSAAEVREWHQSGALPPTQEQLPDDTRKKKKPRPSHRSAQSRATSAT